MNHTKSFSGWEVRWMSLLVCQSKMRDVVSSSLAAAANATAAHECDMSLNMSMSLNLRWMCVFSLCRWLSKVIDMHKWMRLCCAAKWMLTEMRLYVWGRGKTRVKRRVCNHSQARPPGNHRVEHVKWFAFTRSYSSHLRLLGAVHWTASVLRSVL